MDVLSAPIGALVWKICNTGMLLRVYTLLKGKYNHKYKYNYDTKKPLCVMPCQRCIHSLYNVYPFVLWIFIVGKNTIFYGIHYTLGSLRHFNG